MEVHACLRCSSRIPIPESAIQVWQTLSPFNQYADFALSALIEDCREKDCVGTRCLATGSSIFL